MNHVFLIGFMGAGKSTVGPKLAHRLELPFIDLDDEIVAGQGRPVAEVFADQGEARFRELEHEALASLADKPPAVVACGGGIVTLAENRALLGRLGTVVYLRTTAAESIARIGNTSSRPLLVGADSEVRAATLLDTRLSLYSEVADVEIDTVGQTPADLAERIAQLISQRGAVR